MRTQYFTVQCSLAFTCVLISRISQTNRWPNSVFVYLYLCICVFVCLELVVQWRAVASWAVASLRRASGQTRRREKERCKRSVAWQMPQCHFWEKPIFSMLWSVSGILTGYSYHHRTWSKQLTAPHSQNFAVQYFSPTHAIFCGLRNFGPFLDFCNRILMTCIFLFDSLMKLLVCNFVYVHRILCFLIELVWHLMVRGKWQVLSKAASRLAEGAECLKVFYIFLSETGGGTLGQLPWPTCLGAPHLGGDLPLELLACQSLHIVETFTDEDVARLKVFYQSRVDLCFYLWTACMST